LHLGKKNGRDSKCGKQRGKGENEEKVEDGALPPSPKKVGPNPEGEETRQIRGRRGKFGRKGKIPVSQPH